VAVARFAYNLNDFTFYVSDQRAWGVSSALQALALYPPGYEAERQVGKAAHTAVELYLLYGVQPHQHTPHTRARLEQFLRYLDRERVIPVGIEVFAYAMVEHVPIVAITDLIVLTPANTLRVVDIKTGADRYPNNIQTAAEALTLQSAGLPIAERQVLTLHEDRYVRAHHRRQQDFDDLKKLFLKLGPRPQKLTTYEADLRSS
jgi:hypothetical protein